MHYVVNEITKNLIYFDGVGDPGVLLGIRVFGPEELVINFVT